MSCHMCGTPFPKESPELVPAPINGAWECEPCATAARNQLIEQLKEKNRLKQMERDAKELEKRREKEEARLKREADIL